MSFIALFMPACISMLIRHRRKKESYSVKNILEYAVLVIANVWMSQIIIVYILGIKEVDMTAFQSFPFFTKYMLISVITACLLPYAEEIFCKYIGISFTVEQVGEEDKKQGMKDKHGKQ